MYVWFHLHSYFWDLISKLSDTCQYWAKVSTNHLALSPSEREKKSLQCCFHVLILSHFTSRPLDLPQQDLIKLELCLQMLLGDREKTPILHRGMVLFFPFHILFETWKAQNIPRESDRAQLQAMYYLDMLSELFTCSSRFEKGLIVYCMPLHMTAVKQ